MNCLFFAALEGIGRKVKTRALMSVASANEDHNHVISVRKYRNLQEAVQRLVHVDIGRCHWFSKITYLLSFSFIPPWPLSRPLEKWSLQIPKVETKGKRFYFRRSCWFSVKTYKTKLKVFANTRSLFWVTFSNNTNISSYCNIKLCSVKQWILLRKTVKVPIFFNIRN